jgi:BlaI family transcriptional regulator, penicillinase repressor
LVDGNLLNSQELEILTVLWDRAPLKPAEIQEKLSFTIKNSALRWQLGEMVQRGYLKREPLGKAFVYSAVSPRRQVFGSFARRLRQMLFGGSALAMVGEMLEIGELSPKDLQALIDVAKNKESRPSGSQSRKK